MRGHGSGLLDTKLQELKGKKDLPLKNELGMLIQQKHLPITICKYVYPSLDPPVTWISELVRQQSVLKH